MRRFASIFFLLIAAQSHAAATKPTVAHLSEKQLAAQSIDAAGEQLGALSDQIWRYAETALQETKSSKALADYAEQKGFRVTRGVAGISNIVQAAIAHHPGIVVPWRIHPKPVADEGLLAARIARPNLLDHGGTLVDRFAAP